MSISFAVTSTRISPNDAPVMELNEKRTFAFKLAGSLATATISSATLTSDNLTIGSVTVATVNASAPVTASALGAHMLKLTATLSTGEIVVRVIRVAVVDTTQQTGSRDYE